MKSVVILISGRGSNMQAILEAGLPVAAVISNNPAAEGLMFAQTRGIPTQVIDHRTFPDRKAFDAALAETIDTINLIWSSWPFSCVFCRKHL